MANKHVILSRDTTVRFVPSGSEWLAPAGTAVTIVQQLGHSFTVNMLGNLARIDSKDADALGETSQSVLLDLPSGTSIKDTIWAQLGQVFDPEIPVNIVELGLIYACDIEACADGSYGVRVEMTLTAPGCGMGPVLVEDVRHNLQCIPGVSQVDIQLVFDPPWDRSMMSDHAKLELGLF